MAQTCLPPGFRFHPTDVELVSYYLKRKIMGKKLFVQAISEVELYKFAPWDLPDKSCLQSKDLEWFFFCSHDKKYPKGSRTNRVTPNGYWKTSGNDRTIELNSRIVGLKKTLIFHEGKAPKGNRTDWVMYEYKMEDDNLVSAGFSKDAYVLCKIFKKSGLGPRIGEQHGAPFDEEEWENLDIETSVLNFMPPSEIVNSAEHASAALVGQEPAVEHIAATREVNNSSNVLNLTPSSEIINSAEHSSAALVGQEPAIEHIAATRDVNNSSNEVNDAPPAIDGILLEELSMFLDDSPHRDIPFGEHSGLPPMSELEAQAFEINNYDLYNELAGLAWSGGVSTTENNFQRTYSELAISDDYLELDDLLAPGATFSYDLPVPNSQVLQYPLDQSTYYGHYDDGATLFDAFAASGSLPPMPSIFDDLPSVPNNNGFTTDLLNPNYSGPTMKDPFS